MALTDCLAGALIYAGNALDSISVAITGRSLNANCPCTVPSITSLAMSMRLISLRLLTSRLRYDSTNVFPFAGV